MTKMSIFKRNGARLIGFLLPILACLTVFGQNGKVQISPPDWLRNGVVYEIYPRDFSKESNFSGITARLDDLKALGVNVLWLMPIHPIGEKLRKGCCGSPYAVKDYYAINPDYGTEADFKRLISEAHRRGLKVIMDMVANHTAWDSVLISHKEYYKQDAQGNVVPPVPEWSDVAGLNYANADLRQYMITMFKHWIDPDGFDVDGFRCDAAEMVPVGFWEDARAELTKIKPDIILLAEASKPELMVKAFDLDYGWPLMHTLNNVMMRGAPASSLRETWENSRRRFPEGTLHMAISDDHDEPRAVARFGMEGALAASAFLFTLDGVPLLYNGMEVGDATESGDPALFERNPIFWQPKERPPLTKIYTQLIALRKAYAAFHNQNVDWLHNSDEANIVSILRRDATDEFVVVINFSNRPETAQVQVADRGTFKPVKISGLPEAAGGGLADLHLTGFEWRIFHRVGAAPIEAARQTSSSHTE
jgi:cyclomaltodextrinase / maltogenic alpha-amylase / neopullulanase